MQHAFSGVSARCHPRAVTDCGQQSTGMAWRGAELTLTILRPADVRKHPDGWDKKPKETKRNALFVCAAKCGEGVKARGWREVQQYHQHDHCWRTCIQPCPLSMSYCSTSPRLGFAPTSRCTLCNDVPCKDHGGQLVLRKEKWLIDRSIGESIYPSPRRKDAR